MLSDIGRRAISAQTLASLRCPGGADTGDTCLSDPQLAVIQAAHTTMNLPYKLADPNAASSFACAQGRVPFGGEEDDDDRGSGGHGEGDD
jgi:hypothetical protein